MILIALFAAAVQLPLVEVPVSKPGERFAVIVTGDGGWRHIDATIAERLRTHGIPTVGLDAAAYFRTRRTPEEMSKALESIIREYRGRWHRRQVLLIGYSRGADVLPFMINRLPQDLRSSISVIALLGLEPMVDFKLEPWWTLAAHLPSDEPQFAVKPEVDKLRGDRVVCIYGVDEKDSLCPQLGAGFTIIAEPGGHHFAGNYDALVDSILAKAR